MGYNENKTEKLMYGNVVRSSPLPNAETRKQPSSVAFNFSIFIFMHEKHIFLHLTLQKPPSNRQTK